MLQLIEDLKKLLDPWNRISSQSKLADESCGVDPSLKLTYKTQPKETYYQTNQFSLTISGTKSNVTTSSVPFKGTTLCWTV